MLRKLREKIRRRGKEERSDDTKEHVHAAHLSQKGKDRVVSEGGKSRPEEIDGDTYVDRSVDDTKRLNEESTKKDSRTQNFDQQDEVKCQEANLDGVDTKTPGDTKDEPGNVDLWQRAFDELNADLRGHLRENEAMSPENVIQEVIDRTKESFEAFQNGGLKFKKYDGKEVNVRDVAKKILNSATRCSEIIKGIAAFDPSNHASNAWAIVSLGLTMVKNSMDQREAAFKSSEFLADILARYVILDAHCRKKKLSSSDGLDNAIVQVYKAILEYTAEVKKRWDASLLNRIGNSIFPVSDTELSRLQSAVKDQDQEVSNWSQINNYIYQCAKGDEILANIEKVYQNTEIIKVKVNSDERHKILTWLSDIQYSHTQIDHQRVRTDNTGDWLLCSDEYREWKAVPGKLLWLYGPAGCGKSILCSTIIGDIEKDYSSDLFYWYFQFNRNETQNVKNMTRSIIRQLVPEELPKSLISLWEEHDRKNRDPDHDKFLTILNDVIGSHARDHLFLIFDALDECPDNEVYERNLLFQVLKGLIDDHGKKVHLLATSRYEENIRYHLDDSMKIDLEDRMNDDVEAFVRNALDYGKLSRWKKEKGVNDQILAKLLDTEEPRRFRWADLQIKRLEKCKKKDKITESLETIPKSLEETYRRILEEVPEDEQKDARSILTWLSFSLVPLELEAVAAVVGFSHPESVVETCTTYLVTVSPSSGTIKLAHFSVKEFLVVSDPIDWFQLTTIGGHIDIANHALDNLLRQTEALTKEPAHSLSLLKYAAHYWAGHFSELAESGTKFPDLEKKHLEAKIYRLFEERMIYLNWRRVALENFSLSFWYIDENGIEPPIYLACEMGMQVVVERLLSQGANPCATYYEFVGKRISACQIAAANGHLTIVKQLLGSIDVSVEIASDIARSIDLNTASHKAIDAILNILLGTEIEVFYDNPANGCILLNEDFAEAVAGNDTSGHQLLCLLLDKQVRLETPVTERVLEALLKNRRCGEEMMRMLCDGRWNDIQITENLMISISLYSGYNPSTATAILQNIGARVHLNQRIIRHFMMMASVEVVELLLQVSGDKIQVSEELLEATLDRPGIAVLTLLCKRVPDIAFSSPNVLQHIISSRNGLECMESLLMEFHQGYFLQNDIVQKVAKHAGDPSLLRMLLGKREAGLVVFDLSEATMMAAASNWYCPQQMMEMVLNNADSEISINEQILSSAAGNSLGRKSALEYLLELHKNLSITEEALVSAARAKEILCVDCKALEFLFEKFLDAPVSDHVFKATGERPEALLTCRLHRGGRHIKYCQMIGKLLEQDIVSLQKLIELLDARLLEIDESLVDAVGIQNAQILAFHRRYAMEKLLELPINDMTVTEEVILKALDEVQVDDEALKMLIDRLGSTVPVTEKVLEVAFLNDQSRLLDLLLKGESSWNLQRVWVAIWQNNGCEFKRIARAARALLKYGEFDISQTLLEFLPLQDAHGFDHKDCDELSNLFGEQSLSTPATKILSEIQFGYSDPRNILRFINQLGSGVPMTEKAWNALWRNDKCSFKQKTMLSNFLLQCGSFDISPILLEFLPPRYKDGGLGQKYCDGLHRELDELTSLCSGRDISVPATGILSEILFDNGSAQNIREFIEHKPTIQLTDGLIERAEKNKRLNKAFKAFLYSKRAADPNIKAAETKEEAEEG
ncbi:hypothetical protein BDV26DRAFT_290576 [Aspergillus bertholletiae]|uniref:NACHT domain-containing protein n=1 Tax=Aspergillus bertholletiae TaxID=1226010 RepID=A0A5N7BEI3_9EURO|nr:hypothetical protein BDV26DRAFT_290576 [Aspergillus bertholletiae]